MKNSYGLAVLRTRAALLKRFVAAAESIATVVFPPSCTACAMPLAATPSSGLCPNCVELIEYNQPEFACVRCAEPEAAPHCPRCQGDAPPYDQIIAPLLYGGPVAQLVTQAKFHGREGCAAALGTLWLEHGSDTFQQRLALDEAAGMPEAVVAIPLGKKRRRQRGYNQSSVMAAQIARGLDIPQRFILRRTRNTAAQSQLSRLARSHNVVDAFAAQPCSGHILLVDDVVTSGNTVRDAARALRQAGAERVTVAAAARAQLEGALWQAA